eukprot:297061_1
MPSKLSLVLILCYLYFTLTTQISDCPNTDYKCYGPCVEKEQAAKSACGAIQDQTRESTSTEACDMPGCSKKAIIHKLAFHKCTETKPGHKAVCTKKVDPSEHLYLGEAVAFTKEAIDGVTKQKVRQEVEDNDGTPDVYEAAKVQKSQANKIWGLSVPEILSLIAWIEDGSLATQIRRQWWDGTVKPKEGQGMAAAPNVAAAIYSATHHPHAKDWIADPKITYNNAAATHLYFGMQMKDATGNLGKGTLFGPVSTTPELSVALASDFGATGTVIKIPLTKLKGSKLGGVVDLSYLREHEAEWLLYDIPLAICEIWYGEKTYNNNKLVHKKLDSVDTTNTFYKNGRRKKDNSAHSQLYNVYKDGHVHSKPSLVGDDSPHSHRHYHEMNRLDYAHSHVDDGYGDEKAYMAPVPMDANSGVEYWQVLELFVGGTMMIVLTLVFCFGLVFCAAGLAMYWFYTHLEVKRTEKKVTMYQQANE